MLHLTSIRELSGAFCGGELVARGPAWGSQHSGDRVSLRGHRSALMGAVGTDLRERVRIRAHSINGFYPDFLPLSVPVPLKQQTILLYSSTSSRPPAR